MKKPTTNNNGITAIYVRRSVSDKDKGNNSLSISAQREECIKFVGNCEYQVYCDDGKSGKDVQHRPAFMQMMQDARDGLISRIVVKKYDRFSRNMREYLNITDELDRYGVSVYSLSEPFFSELYHQNYLSDYNSLPFPHILPCLLEVLPSSAELPRMTREPALHR